MLPRPGDEYGRYAPRVVESQVADMPNYGSMLHERHSLGHADLTPLARTIQIPQPLSSALHPPYAFRISNISNAQLPWLDATAITQ